MKKLILILTALLIATFVFGALAEESANIPSIVPAQSKDDYIGSWQLSGASVFDIIYFTAEEFGLSAELTINESTMTIKFDADTGTSTWELLDDGSLKYTDPDGSYGFFFLRDDGTISTDEETTDEDGNTFTITMYFARVPEA